MRAAIVVTLGLVFGAALFWLVRGGDRSPPDEVASPTGLDATDSEAREELVASESTGGASPATNRNAVELATPPEGSRGLSCVGPDGSPAKGALVHFLPNAGEDDRMAYFALNSLDAWMDRHGTRRRVDDLGNVSIPGVPGTPILVTAMQGSRWGRAWIEAEDDLEIELHEDRELCVRVLDLDGRPVPGTPVEIRSHSGTMPWVEHRSRTLTEDGLATFRHVQETFATHPEYAWSVGIGGLVRESAAVSVDPEALPLEPLTLTLPAAGTLEVHVLDEQGRRYANSVHVSARFLDENELGTPRDPVVVEQDAKDGVARFSPVELGRELEIRGRPDGAAVSTRLFTFGPGRPDEVRRVELLLGIDHPVLRLRAIDESGSPLPRTELEVEPPALARLGALNRRSSVTTDDEGFLRVDLDSTPGAGSAFTLRRKTDGEPALRGEVVIDRALEPGQHDLGDVVLRPVPLLVAGNVVTPEGDPVAGARLVLQRRGEGKRAWDPLPDPQRRTSAEGRFEIFGEDPGGACRLGAILEGKAGLPRPFSRGQDDLVLELAPEAVIEGRLLFDEEVPPDRLKVEVRGENDEVLHLPSSARRRSPDEDGRFRLGGLTTGLYRVLVFLESRPEPLVEVRAVFAASGETTRDDERLDPIDLTKLVSVHRLRLLTAEPGAPLHGEVTFGPGGASRLENRHSIQGSEVRLLTVHPVLDAVVTARGYAPHRLEGLSGRADVPLTEGPLVRLILGGSAALPEPPLYVKAELISVDGGGRSLSLGPERFDDSRELLVRAPGTGRMRIEWGGERRTADQSYGMSCPIQPPQFVVVQDTSAEQAFEITLSEEQMRELVGILDGTRSLLHPGGLLGDH